MVGAHSWPNAEAIVLSFVVGIVFHEDIVAMSIQSGDPVGSVRQTLAACKNLLEQQSVHQTVPNTNSPGAGSAPIPQVKYFLASVLIACKSATECSQLSVTSPSPSDTANAVRLR